MPVVVGVARFGREDPRAESRILSVKHLVTRVTQVNNELQALRSVALFNILSKGRGGRNVHFHFKDMQKHSRAT
jgi:hypothetical protein